MGCFFPGGGGFSAFRIQLYPSPNAMAKEGIAAGGAMDVHTALQDVLKTALVHCGLAHEVCTAATALDYSSDTEVPLLLLCPQSPPGAPPASGDLSLDSAKRNWDSRTRNTDRNSAEGAWRATGQSIPSHWLPCPGARLALPLLPHEAVPTASLDSPRHASPDQTQLRNEEEKKPTLSRAASQYPMQILVAKA
ncbi:hypothetical protein E5288_WYG021198 [Bos mutus]|uniref:Uncharacterized protein n=1 Tax=Bos mutus TaxID=72004 RepID=A0A6B0RTI9_9CETA|nr:hypothetical protein [Bos mutus]